jgi:nucleolar GTP-binding protein
MNFQDLIKIEKSDFYIDLAIKKAKSAAELKRSTKTANRLDKSRMVEIEKIRTIDKSIQSSLSAIIKKYPSMDSLPIFYQELIESVLSIDEIKKSLSKINFVIKKSKELERTYVSKISRSTDNNDINSKRREYYGRISSLLKQISDELNHLEFARKELKEFPSVKTNIPTVCICGFPNVGKSTLLKKLTGSNVKISSYAFTTKQLLMGYANIGYNKVQFIDTPGVLNRIDKKNIIEHQAYLAVKYLTNCCIFVLDITGSCGYDLKKQLKLLSDLKKEFSKKFLVYLSKTDLVQEKELSNFISSKNYTVCKNDEELLNEIRNCLRDWDS